VCGGEGGGGGGGHILLHQLGCQLAMVLRVCGRVCVESSVWQSNHQNQLETVRLECVRVCVGVSAW
jgi:hypothetical protein